MSEGTPPASARGGAPSLRVARGRGRARGRGARGRGSGRPLPTVPAPNGAASSSSAAAPHKSSDGNDAEKLLELSRKRCKELEDRLRALQAEPALGYSPAFWDATWKVSARRSASMFPEELAEVQEAIERERRREEYAERDGAEEGESGDGVEAEAGDGSDGEEGEVQPQQQHTVLQIEKGNDDSDSDSDSTDDDDDVMSFAWRSLSSWRDRQYARREENEAKATSSGEADDDRAVEDDDDDDDDDDDEEEEEEGGEDRTGREDKKSTEAISMSETSNGAAGVDVEAPSREESRETVRGDEVPAEREGGSGDSGKKKKRKRSKTKTKSTKPSEREGLRKKKRSRTDDDLPSKLDKSGEGGAENGDGGDEGEERAARNRSSTDVQSLRAPSKWAAGVRQSITPTSTRSRATTSGKDAERTIRKPQALRLDPNTERQIDTSIADSLERRKLARSRRKAFQMLCPRIQGTDAEITHDRLRLQAIEEIITSEKDFVIDLEWIIELWLEPIRAMDILSSGEVNKIFSNIEVILGVNQVLLSAMKKRVRRADYTQVQLGEVFLQLGAFLKTYTTYVGNHPVSIEVYTAALKKNPKFESFVTEVQKKPQVRGLSLLDFLVKPIQRICKYPLLLRELIHHTSPDHPDYRSLLLAMEKLETVAAYVNEHKRHQENQSMVMEIANQFVGVPIEVLVTPTRRYIMEATFQKISKGKTQERHFVLFNDCIVYARIVVRGTKRQYQFRDKLDLAMIVCDDQALNHSGFPADRHAFELTRMDSKMKKYIVCASSAQEKKKWMEAIMHHHKEIINLERSKEVLLVSPRGSTADFTR